VVGLVRLPADVLFLTADYLRLTLWGIVRGGLPIWGSHWPRFGTRSDDGVVGVGSFKARRCNLGRKYGNAAILRGLLPRAFPVHLGQGRRTWVWEQGGAERPSTWTRYVAVGAVLLLFWGTIAFAVKAVVDRGWQARHQPWARQRPTATAPAPQPTPDPAAAATLCKEADRQWAARSFQEALATYRAAVAADPELVGARLGIGLAALELGLNDEARQTFLWVLGRDPVDVEANLGLARALQAQGSHRKAIEAADTLLRAAPDDPRALTLKAACLLSLGDGAAAGEAVARALRAAPKDGGVLAMAAEVEVQRGDLPAAEAHYRAAMAAGDTGARVGLARILRLKGDTATAESTLEAHLAEQPDDPKASEELVMTLSAAGRTAEALDRCRTAVAGHPERVSLRERLCGLLLALGWDHQTFAAASALLADAPGNAVAHLHLALVYHRKGLWSLAAKHCDLALAENAALTGATRLHASALMQSGAFEEAAKRLAGLLKGAPADVALAGQLAECHARMEQPAEALSLLRATVQANPGSAAARLLLAQACFWAGKTEEAGAVFKAVREVSPDDVVALNNLAAVATALNADLDRALACALRARELAPGNPQTIDTLGWVYFRRKEHDQALPLAALATALAPDRPELLYHYGEVLAALGRDREAGEALRRALALGVRYAEKEATTERLKQIEAGARAGAPRP